MSRDPTTIDAADGAQRRATPRLWRPLEPQPGFSGWTDDHASILPIINFRSCCLRFGR